MSYEDYDEDNLHPAAIKVNRLGFMRDAELRGLRKALKARLLRADVSNRDRAAKVVEWEWAGLKNRDIARELGITEGTLINWKTSHRDLLNAEYEKLEKQLEQDRSIRRLRAKDEVGKRLDKALDAVDSCLVAESEAVRAKTAFAVLDRIDPVSKHEVNVTLGVFSNKTAGLLQAALPIDAEEAELVGEDDEPEQLSERVQAGERAGE